MKIDRLISIIMILLEHEKISAPELAKMFEVTTRTIYRDIDTIALAGIPIITYPGLHGGIGIMEKYKVDKMLFSRADISTLLMGLQTVSSTLSDKEVKGTLAKIKNLIPDKQLEETTLKSSQIAIDLTPWVGNSELQKNIEKIKTALDENRHLSFEYLVPGKRKSKRVVEPYQLVLKDSSWYLQAYCTGKKDFRVFKLLRITKLKVAKSTFTPQDFHAKPLSGKGWIEHKVITIKLLIDKSLKERILERTSEKNIKPYDRKRLMVNLPFVDDEHGYNLLLSYGDKCECIEPENIRSELIKRVNRLLKIYK